MEEARAMTYENRMERTLTTPERIVFRVREGRVLLYADGRDPHVDRINNTWGRAGEFVVADHPVLRAIVARSAAQGQALLPGEVIPKGSIVHTEVTSSTVRALIARYGWDDPEMAKTPEDQVIGEDGRIEGVRR